MSLLSRFKVTSHHDRSPLSLLIVLVGLGCAVAIGYLVGTDQFSYRILIIGFTLGAVLAALIAGERGLYIGFLLWIGTFALGYRTIRISPHFLLYPSEIVLWGLVGMIIIFRIIQPTFRPHYHWPSWLPWFIPFWFWGWIVGLGAGWPLDRIASDFRNFLLLIPMILVTSSMLAKPDRWPLILATMVAVSIWISFWGSLEYLFPTIKNIFPGFITNPIPGLSQEGFMRAQFSFWGAAAATFICAIFLPFNLVVWRQWKHLWLRILLLVVIGIQLFAIYIGGYRSIWLLTGIVIAVWLMYRVGMLFGSLLLALFLGAYRFLPEPAQLRIDSLIVALEGSPIDSSAAKRWDRVLETWQTAWQNPFGVGWSGTGWVHSDFIQIAANLGLLAGLLFLGAYLFTLWRIWRHVQALPHDQRANSTGLTLLLAFIVVGGLLMFQGVQVLTQLILPVWLVWVLVEVWLKQHSKQQRTIPSRGLR
ncbi:MAG: hypothetical protein AB4911_23985 [Oscillochloridaceae bacterium umkhey_bin13]